MWKKLWKDDEAVSPVIAVILMVAITVVLAAVLYVWAQSFTSDQDTALTIGWAQTTVGDNYKIDIIEVDTIGTDEVAFSLLTPESAPVVYEQDEGETGGLGDLRFVEVDLADITYDADLLKDAEDDPLLWADSPFYEQNDGENWTAFVVFMDVNEDGKANSGDALWIRSTENDGLVEEDYQFRLINKQMDKAYGTLSLSPT